MILEGFKFGMLLQIAIGPVCMYIFSLGVNSGIFAAISGVLGVTLADGMYILLALLGISSFVKDEKVQKIFTRIGAVIVIIFGLELLLSYFGFSLLPKINIFGNQSSDSPFLKAFLLTGANPMTILFWIGVFGSKTNDKDFTKESRLPFSIGALLATLIFLTLVGILGNVTSTFLDSFTLSVLNMIVGLVLIYFGGKKLINS